MIWIHPISDGRDTPPRSFSEFYSRLMEVIDNDKNAEIGTVWGRYYGMDRSKNWDLIQIAVDALRDAKGIKTNNFLDAVQKAYGSEKTPDDVPMFDEYLLPLINEKYNGMNAGDIVINFNYRQDRAIQISRALTDATCPIFQKENASIHYFGLTRYYNEFKGFLMPPMDDSGGLDNILGEVLSNAGKTQLRIAETQKFRHVTSFFNGKSTTPFQKETQIEIPSQWDPATFANHPEMNARDVTDQLLIELDKGYDFIAVNYANCDMVGHTGDFDAAVHAAELVDENVAIVARAAMDKDYAVIVCADHGNSEEMLDEKGGVKTSHTTNPIKLHLIDSKTGYQFTVKKGILSDIAALVLKIMELPIPADMTSRNLVDHLAQS